MKDLLKQLCGIPGVSGYEDKVREEIIKQVENYASEIKTDVLGNLIVTVEGKERVPLKIMIAAHMDEVGFIVTFISEDGLVSFAPVGGVDVTTLPGKRVLSDSGIVGVIGAKPYHLLSAEERGKAVSLDDLYIDFGADSKEELASHICEGDVLCFEREFIEMGDSTVYAPAIDDRAGCAAMIDIIKSGCPVDTTFVFTVQEEVGTRGAATATYSVNPDIAIVLEATTAADISGVSPQDRVCVLGDGPAVSFMDMCAIYDRKLFNLALSTAKSYEIPVQLKQKLSGRNDSKAIHLSGNGVRTMALSVPCRYLHTQGCIINTKDLVNMTILTKALMRKVSNLD